MNPIFYIDFYKVGHQFQYPEDITQVWSNWTPRTTRIPSITRVVNFGLTYFIKRYLMEEFDREFFARSTESVREEYREVIQATLGTDPDTSHIEAVHRLGYLPLKIYALPEGNRVPLNVPKAVFTNTKQGYHYRWLPNYLETVISNICWKPSTTTTTARIFREIFVKWARAAGEKDLSFIDWMGHDFSMRGMSGLDDAKSSGMGHLLMFSGTDTVPAILEARKYYGAPLSCGGSVPATEHSVMCAGGKDSEFETFNRLLTQVYPAGIVSVVSDTWDLWKVLTDYIPRLKDHILNRPATAFGQPGKIVIRPDSGDPVKILCGDPAYAHVHGAPQAAGAIRLLAQALGTSPSWAGGNLPLINNAGVIYGDAISPARAEEILSRTVNELKLSPYNVVFGIGSYSYQYVTRDTHGYAMKATAVRRGNGEIEAIFKKPVTDDGGKFSHKGIPTVYDANYVKDSNGNTRGYISPEPDYFVIEGSTEYALDECAFDKVFEDGKLLVDPKFSEIRDRARAGI